MSWLILLAVTLTVFAVRGVGPKRVNRFRPFGKLRLGRRFKPDFGFRTGRLELDLPKPFASGEVEGTIPDENDGMVTFNLGEVPAGAVVYIAAVEFEGGGYQGSGFYRLIAEGQPAGWSQIQVGPVMYNGINPQFFLLPWVLRLSAYLVDRSQGPIGFAGFSIYDGRMFFSVVQQFRSSVEGINVRVKWQAFET